MKTFPGIVICLVATITGCVIGAVGAFFGTLAPLVLIDWLNDARPGNQILAVGWIYCLFTVPAGFLGGGYVGLALAVFTGDKADRSK